MIKVTLTTIEPGSINMALITKKVLKDSESFKKNFLPSKNINKYEVNLDEVFLTNFEDCAESVIFEIDKMIRDFGYYAIKQSRELAVIVETNNQIMSFSSYHVSSENDMREMLLDDLKSLTSCKY